MIVTRRRCQVHVVSSTKQFITHADLLIACLWSCHHGRFVSRIDAYCGEQGILIQTLWKATVNSLPSPQYRTSSANQMVHTPTNPSRPQRTIFLTPYALHPPSTDRACGSGTGPPPTLARPHPRGSSSSSSAATRGTSAAGRGGGRLSQSREGWWRGWTCPRRGTHPSHTTT